MTSSAAREKRPVTWTTREASSTDMAGILECREVTFADEEVEKQDPAYWRWEFVDNHAGPARLFVAEDGSRIVGHYAVIPQRFVLDEEMVPGSIVVDVMTHPDYRFQGMFTALGRFALEKCTADPQFEFTTGYPIRPEVVPGHLKVGWKIRFKIGTWVMPLATGKVLAAKFPRVGAVPGLAAVLGAVPGLGLRLWSRSALATRRSTRVERMTVCDPELFAPFWEEFRQHPPRGCLIQERTPEYLAWRFDANPKRSYTYHVALDDGGRVVGFVVSRVAPLLGVDAMIIVDACLLPGQGNSVIRALIADVRDRALEDHCPMLAMMATQPNPFFGNPIGLGFVPAPYKFSFITRELAAQTVISRSLQWHLMWGDTDDI